MEVQPVSVMLLFRSRLSVGQASADGPSAEELARKAQDPLADVKALMTDNTIGFAKVDDETSYGFQLQPVYSIPTGQPFNLISRAAIPIVGAPVGAVLPRLGDEPIENEGTAGADWQLKFGISWFLP